MLVFKDATEKRLRRIELDLDELSGKSMELDATKKLGNYLRSKVRRVRAVDRDLVNGIIDLALDLGAFSEKEGEELGEADALVVGKDRETGAMVCVAVEVSRTVHKADVERAEKRAQLFLKASQAATRTEPSEIGRLFPSVPSKALALVVGKFIPDLVRQEAERRGVLLAKYQDGYGADG